MYSARARSYMTRVFARVCVSDTSVFSLRYTIQTLGYIYLSRASSPPLPFHLLLIPLPLPPPRFLQLRPCALFLLGATLSHLTSLRRRAFSLGSLALLLSRYLGSDSICRTMLFTMWLHAGGLCSLGAMLELRRRVSLQSTTLLGTQNASRRASIFADHRHI